MLENCENAQGGIFFISFNQDKRYSVNLHDKDNLPIPYTGEVGTSMVYIFTYHNYQD